MKRNFYPFIKTLSATGLLQLAFCLVCLQAQAAPLKAPTTGKVWGETADQSLASLRQTAEDVPYLVVENLDGFPAPDHLAFSKVQEPWHRDGTAYNRNHDEVKLRISNKGTGTLTITNLSLSDAGTWKIQLNGKDFAAAAALPLTLKAGGNVVLTLVFTAKDQADRVKVLHNTLTITTNDKQNPEKKVYLHGVWQKQGEDVREPWAQEIIQAFGFKTRTGYNHDDGSVDGETIVPNSDEVLSSYFVRADESLPVEVTQMSAYHNCCTETETFRWYDKGSSSYTTLFTHNGLDAQSLLPRIKGSNTALAQGHFKPSKAFGFRVGSAYSDRNKNDQNKIGMRIWKAIDADGNIIPNAYIVGTDYLGTQYTNYDYQDNVYFVSNVRPEEGTAHFSELTAAPSALSFKEVQAKNSSRLTVSLTNQGKTYAGGESDPAIQIRSIEVTGPNQQEFAAAAPAAATLAVQATTSIPVTFTPKSRGLKNAVLLVHYNTSDTPLRIPLYGIGRDADSTVVAVKRIKGAADVAVTINGKVWEADKSYRKGSIKLDKQMVTTPIAATDDDVLYQTYLSAATDLAETRYEIPVAKGTYRVRMHFVENYWHAVAERIFSVVIEDQLQLANFDIYKEAGYRTALVKDFEVKVTDGTMNIRFTPTANRVALAGLELFQDSASASVTGISPELENGGRLVQGYPNPGHGNEVHLIIEHFNGHETVSIQLYDVVGRLAYTTQVVTDEDGTARTTLKGTLPPKGLYILRATAPSGEAKGRLLLR
ncbi:malectin domain-containing carbohydrate-binding protein [Pontibacter chitinilyticus]|uniref:malectin domain-containing carbohydrate-binding protein n=1 Tax=Pontibacter chitinilyticus TaxID=2674989 RepID=UPI003219CA61